MLKYNDKLVNNGNIMPYTPHTTRVLITVFNDKYLV